MAQVGRPSKGPDARTKARTLKVSEREDQALAEAFGSAGLGLRALVDEWMSRRTAGSTREGSA